MPLIERKKFHTLNDEAQINEQIQLRRNLLSNMNGWDAPEYKQPISDDIAALEVKKIEKKYPSGLEELKELAIFLHEEFCHANHTDGCSWHYEFKRANGAKEAKEHDWTGYAHKYELERAAKILPKLKNIIFKKKITEAFLKKCATHLDKDGNMVVLATMYGSFDWPTVLDTGDSKWEFLSQGTMDAHECRNYGGKAIYKKVD